MKPEELPTNSMMFMIQIKDSGEFLVLSGNNLDEDLDEEQIAYFNDIMTGMFLSFESMMTLYAYIGQMASGSEQLYNELQESEINFEPDEDLLKATKNNKNNRFDKKKLN